MQIIIFIDHKQKIAPFLSVLTVMKPEVLDVLKNLSRFPVNREQIYDVWAKSFSGFCLLLSLIS